MQTSTPILLPVLAQILLTFIVWLSLCSARVGTIVTKRLNPQLLADETQEKRILQGSINISDNFENLLEIPVLFFFAVFLIYQRNLVDTTYVTSAWLFVILRGVHSLIHCTYNKIRHRFFVYILSSVIVWAIWLRLATQLLQTL